MGLDMYLYARECVTNFGNSLKMGYPASLKEFEKLQKERDSLTEERRFRIGYWRNAWPIHSIVCKITGMKVDDDQDKYLMKGEMTKIVNEAKKAWADAEFDDQKETLEYTIKLFELAIKAYDDGYNIIYRASW